MATPVSGTSTSRIVDASGVDWNDWVAVLDHQGARDAPHAEIARIAEQLITSDTSEIHPPISPEAKIRTSPGWWAQGIAVAYEQHIGRRVPGQRADGTFECSVSRTFPEERDSLRDRVFALLESMMIAEDFPVPAEATLRTSSTPKRDYWRITLSDETSLQATIEPRPSKDAVRTAIIMTHARIDSAEAMQQWRDRWSQFLAALG